MTMRIRGAMLVLVSLLLLPSAARAAPPESAREQARAYLMRRLVESLGLSYDSALAVRAVFQKAEERRAALVASREALDRQLRELLARQPADARELDAAIRDANGVDRSLAAITEDSFRDTQALLTREQQAKLLLLRYELQGQVHEAVRGRLGVRHDGAPAHDARKAK